VSAGPASDLKPAWQPLGQQAEGLPGDVVTLVREGLEREPSKPVFIFEDGVEVSRERFREAVESFAGYLREHVKPGDRVLIMLENRVEFMVAWIAANACGASLVSMNTSAGEHDAGHIVKDSEAVLAVVGEEHEALLQGLGHGGMEIVVVRGSEPDGLDSFSSDSGPLALADLEVDPEAVTNVYYTSGTTGPPKGVLLTHHNLLFESTALDRLTGLSPEGSSVSYLPLAHIAERVLSIYGPLTRRSHVWFCPDPTQAVEYVREARPTLFFGVPRVWEKVRAGIQAKLAAEESQRKRRIAERAVATGLEVVRRTQRGERVPFGLRARHAVLDRLVLAKIRHAIGLDRCGFASSAASPLAVDVAEFFAALGLPLVEVYGMTETTAVATGNRPGRVKIGTVGPALAGIEVRLADDGEVLVRGPINTPGYFRQPGATAELIDADGWLHTGDVGELDGDGYLRIVDRKKELIITSSGKNLSPANIEALLKEHPLIGQALVYGDNRPYVVALVVLDHELAPGWVARNGLGGGGDLAALAASEQVLAEVQLAVDAANQRLARVEQVKRFEVLPVEWTAESEELTPTLKLRRRIIHAKYAERIDALYEG
jgi:long-subunit acyl-CoA synthetase (AMP-forming)